MPAKVHWRYNKAYVIPDEKAPLRADAIRDPAKESSEGHELECFARSFRWVPVMSETCFQHNDRPRGLTFAG